MACTCFFDKAERWDVGISISFKLEQEKVEVAEPDHVSGDCPDEPEPATTASLNHGGLFPQLPSCHRGSTHSPHIPTAFAARSGSLAEVWLLKTPWVDGGAVVIWQLWGLTWGNQYVIPLRDKILPWDRWNMKPYQNWDIIQYQLVRRMYFINFHQQ